MIFTESLSDLKAASIADGRPSEALIRSTSAKLKESKIESKEGKEKDTIERREGREGLPGLRKNLSILRKDGEEKEEDTEQMDYIRVLARTPKVTFSGN